MLSFTNYLQSQGINFKIQEDSDHDGSQIFLRFFHSSNSSDLLAFVATTKEEVFFPTHFSYETKKEYELLKVEHLGEKIPLGQEGILPWPSHYKMQGYVSQELYERDHVSIPYQNKYLVIAQNDWKRYCEIEHIKKTASHRFSWPEQLDHPDSIFVKRVIDSLKKPTMFPPMPITALQIIALQGSSATDEDLIRIAEKDMLLSTQLIAYAQSPLYGLYRQISSAREAISNILGFNLAFNLSCKFALGQGFHMPLEGRYGWEHLSIQSLMTADLACFVAKMKNFELNMDKLHLGALCSDMGYFILAQHFHHQYTFIIQEIEANPNIDPCLIEFEHFQFSHQHLATWLLSYWGFCPEVLTTIQWHHSLRCPLPYASYPHCTYLARYYLTPLGWGDEHKVLENLQTLGLTSQEHHLLQQEALRITQLYQPKAGMGASSFLRK